MITTAVVLARGLGTRMRTEGEKDLTPQQAAAAASGHKALMPIGEHRLIDYSLSALADAPWALDPYGSRTGTWARTYLRQAGIEPHVRFATPDPLLQVHLVRTGHAVAFVPGLIASEHLGGTRVLRLPGQPRRSLYTAARAGAARHPSLLAFRAALLEAAGTLTALEDLDSLDA